MSDHGMIEEMPGSPIYEDLDIDIDHQLGPMADEAVDLQEGLASGHDEVPSIIETMAADTLISPDLQDLYGFGDFYVNRADAIGDVYLGAERKQIKYGLVLCSRYFKSENNSVLSD